MNLKRSYFSFTVLFFMSLFVLNGCVSDYMNVPSGDRNASIWGEDQADANGSVDVSDLETSQGDVVPRIAFPAAEYQRLHRMGQGTIRGTIFLTDMNGKKILGKRTRLYLNPVTSYSRQWFEISYRGGKKMAKADKRLFNYLKFTASNAAGKFAFYGVPSGSYYVIGMVKCGFECGYDSPVSIRVAKEVNIDGSGTVSIDLQRPAQ